MNETTIKTVLSAARGMAMPRHYAAFLKAAENDDFATMEREARAIYRLHGTTQSLLSSYSNKAKRVNRPKPTEEEMAAVREAFEGLAPPEYFRK